MNGYSQKPTCYVYTEDGPRPLWTRTNKVPVEQVFNIYTDPQQWFMIPDYPGYEISNYLNIRSYKFMNQFKYGIVIKVTAEGFCTITDKNNLRCKENVNDLWVKAYDYYQKNKPYGYPRPTYAVYGKTTARNKRMFIDNKAIRESTKKIVRKPEPIKGKDDTLFTPHFTVLQEKKIIKPVYFFNEEVIW